MPTEISPSSSICSQAKKDFASRGIKGGEHITLDLDTMMKAKSDSVNGLTGGIEGLFKKNKITYIKGLGKMTSTTEVEVELSEGGKQSIKAKNIMLATGSEVRGEAS